MNNVFSSNPDFIKNAYLNWNVNSNNQLENLHYIAKAYIKSAIFMIECALKDNRDKKADSLIFTVFFAVNHAIEVYEKCIILSIWKAQYSDKKIDNTHNIKQLYENMINEIKNSGEKSKGLEKHLKDLKNYIDELYLYIDEGNKPYIDFSRYPFNVNGEDYFYVISHDNLVIDMDNFLQIVESIYEKLEGLSLLFLEISESSTINYYNE